MKRNTRRSSIAVNFPVAKKRNSASSFSTKFSLPSFIRRVEKLSENQRAAITWTGFGSLLNIHNQLLSKNLLVELMDRWDCDKLAFMLLPGEITITLKDIALILGLRVLGKPVFVDEEEPFSSLEQEYGATAGNRKIGISSIEDRLESIGEIANEDFIRAFLLFTFGTFLFPNASGKVDSHYLSFLKELDKVCEFAWGGAVLQDLFRWLSKRKGDSVQYVGGCLLLLQIWSYEHIHIGRPNLLDSSLNFPRACRWESSRSSMQRQWFSNKFNKLEEIQMTWILKPSVEESQIDVVKELIESESSRENHSEWQPSTSSHSLVERNELVDDSQSATKQLDKLKIESYEYVDRAHNDVQEHASNASRVPLESQDEHLEGPSCSTEFQADISWSNLNELVDDSQSATKQLDKLKIKSFEDVDRADNVVQEHASRAPRESQDEHLEGPPCSTESQVDGSWSNLLSTKHALTQTQKHISKAESTEWNERGQLREENALLRNQLELILVLQEENAKLREEVTKLRRENELINRSTNGLADRLERLLDEYQEGIEEQA